MYFSLNKAAKETGKSTSVISKALKNGTLSFITKTKKGYEIEPSELFRVFSKRTENREQNKQNRRLRIDENDYNNELIINGLEVKLKAEEQEKNLYKEQIQKAEIREKDILKKLDQAQATLHNQTLLLNDMREKPILKPVQSDNSNLGSSGRVMSINALQMPFLFVLVLFFTSILIYITKSFWLPFLN